MILFFVIPCYYDADVLPVTGPVFLKKLTDLIDSGEIDPKSRVVFVNDGSTDGTWNVISDLHGHDAHCVGIDLCENVGEQNALIAGMTYAKDRCDCCITMDSDLQDDIGAVDRMLRAFKAGNEAVFGVRASRKDDSFSERATSKLFYTLMQAVEKCSIPNHSNFRLLSSSAVEKLLVQTDRPFFLPTLAASLNVSACNVYYDRLPRAAGTSGYSFQKRLNLGLFALRAHAARRWFPKAEKNNKTAPETRIRRVLDGEK